MSVYSSKRAAPRLLWINHFARPPGVAGGSRLFEMGRELVRSGWRVEIAASDFHAQTRSYFRRRDKDDRSPIEENVDGVDFRYYWAAPYQTNNWRRAWNWLSFGQEVAARHRDRPSPDVIIGSSPHLFAAASGERLARKLRIPFVFEVRDLWPESIVAAGGRKGPAYFAFDRIAKRLYRRADRIVSLARGTDTYLKGQGIDARKLVYIPNGVDPSAFAHIERPSRSTFTLVYAGAHGPANGLDIVLGAAALLKEREDIRFLLVGDGPAKERLQGEATERRLNNVEFRDPVPKSSMPDVLAEADAGLMVLRDTPLFAYGVSPNKLFDYSGASLPIVCNVPGEVAGMVEDNGIGEIASPGSAESLAAAVLRLASRSREERLEMGSRARSWVSREHDRPVLGARLDAMLRELIR